MSTEPNVDLLLMPVPLWTLGVVCAVFFVLHIRAARRLNSQAESIANMDVWADIVDAELLSLRRSSSKKKYLPQRHGDTVSELWH